MRAAGFLNNALVRAAPGELQAGALEAMLEVAAAAPADFAGGYRAKAPWLQGFLGHVNPAGAPQHCAVPDDTARPAGRSTSSMQCQPKMMPVEKLCR